MLPSELQATSVELQPRLQILFSHVLGSLDTPLSWLFCVCFSLPPDIYLEMNVYLLKRERILPRSPCFYNRPTTTIAWYMTN